MKPLFSCRILLGSLKIGNPRNLHGLHVLSMYKTGRPINPQLHNYYYVYLVVGYTLSPINHVRCELA